MSGSVETAVTPVAASPPASSVNLVSVSGYPPSSTTIQLNADGSSTTTITGPTGAVISTSTSLPNVTTIRTNPDGSITTTITASTGRVISTHTTASLGAASGSTAGGTQNAVNGGVAGSLGLVNFSA